LKTSTILSPINSDPTDLYQIVRVYLYNDLSLKQLKEDHYHATFPYFKLSAQIIS